MKGLRKVHLRDCLVDAKEKEQHKQAAVVKQKCNRKESKRMWCLRKCTVKKTHIGSVLKVQRIVDGEVKEYEVQEDIINTIQRECKARFSLAHSAPITNIVLGEQLRYLMDKALAQSIITGTYEIHSDMDPSTKLILKEVGKLVVKLINKEGTEVIILPKDFKLFWTRVGEFTSSLISGVHYGNTLNVT